MAKDNLTSLPPPSAALINRFEEFYEVRLPDDFKKFLVHSNGIVPTHQCFDSNVGGQVLERFLPLLDDPNAHGEHGQYDIAVVASQLDARLADGTSECGLQLIPIAELFAGDFVVLDFRENKEEPTVAVWLHEQSEDFDPVAHYVSSSFAEFLSKLRVCAER